MLDLSTLRGHPTPIPANRVPSLQPTPVLVSAAVAFTLIAFGSGHSKSAARPEAPISASHGNNTTTQSPPANQIEIPTEYRDLADVVAIEMAANPEDLQPPPPAEAMAEFQAAIATLGTLKSSDSEIRSTAAMGHTALTTLLSQIETLNSLPEPASLDSVRADSFISGLVSGFTLDPTFATDAMNRAVETDKASAALRDQALAIYRTIQTLDKLQLRLPRIAARFAASATPAGDRFQADVDDPWGPTTSLKRLRVFNSGEDLHDCTLAIRLLGKENSSRVNVHFVKHWPAKTWMHARYRVGRPLPNGSMVEEQSVSSIQSVEFTLYSPELSTSFEYAYQGAERDRDANEMCQRLQFKGAFTPFKNGILQDTPATATFTMTSMEPIPPGKVTLTFRRQKQERAWVWNQEGWAPGGEKSFPLPQGEPTFVPEDFLIRLTFPDTTAEYLGRRKI